MDKVVSFSFARNFIDELADWLMEHYIKPGRDLSGCAIVFGGQRPALFLKKELARRVGRSFASPVFLTIDEFIDTLLLRKEPYKPLSDLDACFILYQLARQMAPEILEGRGDFSAFLPWAREILSFIEQLDLEDIDAHALSGIERAAEIGYDVPQSINRLLGHIVTLRAGFHERLTKDRAYVRGLKYLLASRVVAEVPLEDFQEILFCNFFYLHKTEEQIIKRLYERGKARLFFQGSEDDWSVLKKVARDLGISIKPKEDARSPYSLVLKPAFDLHSEVGLVREALEGIDKSEKTVVVLPEPGAVIPLLSEVASHVTEYNVSMGYPLTRSSVYSLFDDLARAQETKKGDTYYSRDYLRVLGHPLVKNLRFKNDAVVTRILVHKIEEVLLGREASDFGGALFIRLADIESLPGVYREAAEMMQKMNLDVSERDLKDIVGELHRLLFGIWELVENLAGFADAVLQWLDLLTHKSYLEKYPLNLSIVERMFELLSEFHNSTFASEPFAKDDLFKIFKDHMQHEAVRFSGSPLKGLQILGLLETRALSFDNVLIMDTNESVLPRLKIYEPLIPRDVMMGLGLNRLEKEEEIQRYQFFRLLGSAKNVFLFYQETKDKERSRFVEDLIWQKQKEAGTLDVLVCQPPSFSIEVLPREVSIPKDDKYAVFLKRFRYSASSINTYLRCPLRFYHQYVLRLQEREDLAEEPEARDVGTFVHGLLEEVFTKFIGRAPRIDAAFRKYFFDTLDQRFERDFRRKMKSDAFLMYEVLRFRLGHFLDFEAKREVREVICVEKAYEGPVRLGEMEVAFKSKIDRIDKLSDGSLLVLDYKTGGSDLMPVSTEKIEGSAWSRHHLKKTVRSFQLPLYYYFVQEACGNSRLNAGFYQLKDLDLKVFFETEEDFAQAKPRMDVLMKALEFICREVLDPSVPFAADPEDTHYCGTCPFFNLCR